MRKGVSMRYLLSYYQMVTGLRNWAIATNLCLSEKELKQIQKGEIPEDRSNELWLFLRDKLLYFLVSTSQEVLSWVQKEETSLDDKLINYVHCESEDLESLFSERRDV